MKVYVHFRESPLHPFTVVVNLSDKNLSVQRINEAIHRCLMQKDVKILKDFGVSLQKGMKTLDPKELVTKLLHDGEDISGKCVPLVKKTKNGSEKPKASSKQKKRLTPDEKRKQQWQEILDYQGSMEPRKLPDGKTQFTPKTVTDWLMLGEKWKVLGEPRKTLDILFSLIKGVHAAPEMYEEIVKIYLEAKRPVTAKSYVEKSLGLFPKYTRIKLREAECLMALNQPDQAIEVLMEYTREMRQDGTAKVEQKHEVQLALCRAYQLKGQRDMALAVILGVVRELQEMDLENIPAMIEYARLTFDLSQKHAGEAATIILTALVGDKDNKFRQKVLAEMCQKSGGLESLLHSMKHTSQDPEGVAFMANIIRKQGAVKESLVLLERAVTLKTKLASVILNYIHMLEVVQNYQKAFDAVVEYLQENPELKAGSVSNRDVLACVDLCIGKQIYLFSNRKSSESDVKSDIAALSFDKLSLTLGEPYQAPEGTEEPGLGSSRDKMPRIVYSEEELYLVALWHTLVKMLYINGAVALIPKLVKLLDPVHKGKNLHTTIIRNEAAFFGSISKIAYTWLDPSLVPCIPAVSRQQNFLYLLGDSHCLSPAWKTIHFRNTPHIIRPLLCTGTKVWHLRPGEVFYPKANFKNCVKQIPHRASVVVLFGEIDCREALMVCYNKCRYESIEEGVNVLLNIYIKTLQELLEEHQWTIFVHPVPPVLKFSRETVTVFNTMLQKRLETEEGLHWLDMVDEMYDKDTSAFKYEFDKTHLHPSYVRLLESAINKVHIPEDNVWTVD